MRILLYGFGPYRQFNGNVTERVLRKIRTRRGLTKIVFPVKFDRSQFIGAVTKYNPEWIIGLGQCSRGALLRIETRAINQRRSSKKAKARPIAPRGAAKLFTNLRPELGWQARRSRHAGDYVCNFSMYVVLETLRRRQLAIRYGFVHIPYAYEPGKAARLVDRALAQMARHESAFGARSRTTPTPAKTWRGGVLISTARKKTAASKPRA
jgi:pyroglutamyl-peptidase